MSRFPGRGVCDRCGHEVSRRANGELVKHPCLEGRVSATTSPYDRVMRHVRRVRGGHLLWTGYLTNGCPMIRTGRRKPNGAREKSESCRRIVWEHHHGPQPKFTNMRSTCGRSECLAVEHMEAQLPRAEERAARRAARAAQLQAWAERRAAVIVAYQSGERVAAIAARFEVQQSFIYGALRAAGLKPSRGGGRYDRTHRRVAAT